MTMALVRLSAKILMLSLLSWPSLAAPESPAPEAADDERRVRAAAASASVVLREGASLYASEMSTDTIGTVTSGGFSPTLNAPVAMGYLPVSLSTEGTIVFADVRGQRLPLRVSAMPFVPNGYKR